MAKLANAERISRANPYRLASETARKQREGTQFTGAFGQRTGESDLLFVEGQLPEREGTVRGDEPASEQLALCLENLKSVLAQRGTSLENVLRMTLYLADMDSYERVNEIYEQYVGETHPARTTVDVCNLLGGASITVVAVVAVE